MTHHVYVKSAATNFDSGEQSIGTTVDPEFDHTGIFSVSWAIHPAMHLHVTMK